MTRLLIEPYVGLGAVGLHLLAGVKPPASRIGCKSGYAAQISTHIGVVDQVLWSDADPALVQALQAMIEGVDISTWFGGDPHERWLEARENRFIDPASWWVHLAGARGGIGGFKGGHIRRPNVDGFIPNRESLARRLDAIAALRLGDRVTITCERADQRFYESGAKVYFDPPYLNTTPYPDDPQQGVGLLTAWWRAHASGASMLLVSERDSVYTLPDAEWHPLKRTGQNRRSLTTSDAELLNVWHR